MRWRRATLDEAKTVLVAYHTQRSLTLTANLVVNYSGMFGHSADPLTEHHQRKVVKNEDLQAESKDNPS
jgi:hypothetical protein